MRIIDFEAHCYIPEFMGKFDRAAIDEANRHLPKDRRITVLDEILDLDSGRIAQMDRCGVSTQLLSLSSGVARLGNAEAIEVSRKANDRMHEAMKRWPGRFGAFAQLPENDVDAAVYELERCMDAYGFFGWNTFSNFGESWLDESFYFPILERASQLGAPVYLHPDFPGNVGFPRLCGLGMSLYAGVGYAYDTATTLLRLMYNGTFDRLPELQIIIGHLGEGLPFFLNRLVTKERDGVLPKRESEKRDAAVNQKSLWHYFRNNIFVTNSSNFSIPAFTCAKDVLGLDRMLFGSDYPYENLETAVEFTKNCGLNDDQLERICWKNAEDAFSSLRGEK